ncbi:MAG TPA: hypothetical protein VNI60_02155 [Pyrinomonadaceae bacterium]|nr:hypothetical protein [Pyrinomonadaceae bacterium]
MITIASAQTVFRLGKWYLGNQIDWIIFGTNTKIIRAQVGFHPTLTIKLRALFHNTR